MECWRQARVPCFKECLFEVGPANMQWWWTGFQESECQGNLTSPKLPCCSCRIPPTRYDDLYPVLRLCLATHLLWRISSHKTCRPKTIFRRPCTKSGTLRENEGVTIRTMSAWRPTIQTYVDPYQTIPYPTLPYHTIPYGTVAYHTIPYQTIPDQTIPYIMPTCVHTCMHTCIYTYTHTHIHT